MFINQINFTITLEYLIFFEEKETKKQKNLPRLCKNSCSFFSKQ